MLLFLLPVLDSSPNIKPGRGSYLGKFTLFACSLDFIDLSKNNFILIPISLKGRRASYLGVTDEEDEFFTHPFLIVI